MVTDRLQRDDPPGAEAVANLRALAWSFSRVLAAVGGVLAVERNARAQTRMIDDLLDVSRVASGKLKIDAQRLALAEIVQSAVTAAQPAAQAKGIALESEIPGGLGLGLALVKHIVELHGGCVRAASEGEDRGATFTVSLPVVSAEERAGAGGSCPLEPLSVAGLHVLIVDDEPEVRELLRHALEEGAAIVRDVASAPDALAEVERFRPDVLVSDIGMPDEDGYHLIQALRGLPPERGGRTPAVALTAFARPEDCARALRSGFQAHLAKPLEPSKLLEVVARLARVALA